MFFKKDNKMDIELCKAEIKRHEGEVLEIYMDSLGYKTLVDALHCPVRQKATRQPVGQVFNTCFKGLAVVSGLLDCVEHTHASTCYF